MSLRDYLFYEEPGITLYCGDCRDVLPLMAVSAETLLLTDPPYGIDYASSMTGHDGGIALPGIDGDDSTALRDYVLNRWIGPAIVFGSWKRPRPLSCRAVLTWDKGSHVGMGDLLLPWKPNTEEVYVLGPGAFTGPRCGSVLRFDAPVTWNSPAFGRQHPHEKPIALLTHLLAKCIAPMVVDSFAGSGTTLEAAKILGIRAIGIEIEPKYCEIAVKRLRQEVLPFS